MGSINMKYFLGIDPGKQGAFVIIDNTCTVIENFPTPLIGKDYNVQAIKKFLLKHKLTYVGLEKPNIIYGASKSSVASLMECVGLFRGILIGMDIPHILIRPKEWQKECWKFVETQKKSDGKVDTKATSTLAALNLFPNIDFKITNKFNRSGNYNSGLVDAVLIAEYTRRLFSNY